jgi:hypothetical protein
LAFGLTLVEMSDEVEFLYMDGEYVRLGKVPKNVVQRPGPLNGRRTKDVPNGRFSLRVYSPYHEAAWERRWDEGRKHELRGKLDEICAEIEREAPKLVKLVEEGEERQRRLDEQHREEMRKWQKEQEERRQAQALKDSRDQLLAIVDAWALASRIEAFFENASRGTETLPGEERDTMRTRLDHTLRMFGGVDALNHFRSWRTPEER